MRLGGSPGIFSEHGLKDCVHRDFLESEPSGLQPWAISPWPEPDSKLMSGDLNSPERRPRVVSIENLRDIQGKATAWRRYLHENPELDYRVHDTAGFVTEKLASFGINHIETGIAETGIVALIQGEGGDGPTIGARADMDALPILEASNKPGAAKNPGKTDASGHDGHTAILLGAAKYLAATRNFKGSVALIFQPAEEDGRGGQRTVQEGIRDRFSMHNQPGLEVGKFGICDGPISAALDEFDIIVKGRGGHSASPNRTIDPIVIAAQVIIGLQTLVSRNTDPNRVARHLRYRVERRPGLQHHSRTR